MDPSLMPIIVAAFNPEAMPIIMAKRPLWPYPYYWRYRPLLFMPITMAIYTPQVLPMIKAPKTTLAMPIIMSF
jgi:hypothetical protein